MTKEELQERLIDFAVLIIEVTKSIKRDAAGNAIINQIVRSGTSPALNYDEANGAESNDLRIATQKSKILNHFIGFRA